MADLFPGSTDKRLTQIARSFCELHLANRALVQLAGAQGIASLADAIGAVGMERMRALLDRREPTILLGFHTGFAYVVDAALAAMRINAVVLKVEQDYAPTESLRVLGTRVGAEQRSLVFMKALRCLRSGGAVLLAGDAGVGAHTAEVSLLGRRMTPPRGPYALSRMSGALMFPLTKRWSAGAIQIEIDEALKAPQAPVDSASEYEDELARQAMQWLEPQLGTDTQVPRRTLLKTLMNAAKY